MTAQPVMARKYQIIYADPPWDVDMLRTGKDKARHFDHYPTMKTKDICLLPIQNICEEDSTLFLWATNTFLPDAFLVLQSWGFKYHCIIVWDKVNGITMRGFHRNTEFLLYGYRGKFPDIFKGKPFPCLVRCDRLKHSQKPSLFRDLISSKFKGKKVELFARQKVEGWDCWGNEVESDVELSG